MIHYHGTPITPRSELQKMAGRSFCVPFSDPRDLVTAHNIGQSVMLDNGAFSAWRRGISINWMDYYGWAEPWLDYHTTWAVIPDVIDGTEEDNDQLVLEWPFGGNGSPVWHLHESLDRLRWLCDTWSRICFGSSGDYATPGTDSWHHRVAEAFNVVAPSGVPDVWVHMLRGLQFSGSEYPFASADSVNVGRNFKDTNSNPEEMARTIDARQCPARWHGNTNMELLCTD